MIKSINKEKKSLLNQSNLLTFLGNYLLFATLTSIFILNNDGAHALYYITRLINLIFTIILALILIIYTVRFKWKTNIFILFLLVFATTLIIILVRNYVVFHGIYLLAIVVLVNEKIQFSKSKRKMIIYICFVIVIFQLYNFRFDQSTPVLSWIDPNYSSYYILLLSFFAMKTNLKITAFILLSLGFLTLSRAYFVAVTLYVIFKYSDFLKKMLFKLKLNSFFKLMIGSSVFILLIGLFFINSSQEVIHLTDRGLNRIFVLSDLSNLHRFIANNKFINSLFLQPGRYLFGVETKTYTESIFVNTPHNSFFAFILNYGIVYFIPYIILYGKSFNRIFSSKNIPIIVAQFVYYTLLGSGIQGFPGVFLFIVLLSD